MSKKVVALTLAVVFALTVALAGCGSSQPAQPAKPAAPQKIVIAYTPWSGYAALFIAQSKGMFKARGLDVEVQSIEGVGDRKQALAAGKIQAMAASIDVSISAAESMPLKYVWAFDSSAGADGLLVKPAIKSFADLKGKQVAYHKGSAAHLMLTELLAKNNMKESDIVAVDMKASEAAAAFMAGKVDAAVTWEPHLSKAVQAGGKLLATSKDTPGLIADVLVFKEDYVKANPQTVQKIVEAMAEATEFLLKNTPEAGKLVAEPLKMKAEDFVKFDFPTLKFYDLKGNIEFYGTADKPGPMVAVTKKAAQFYIDQKVLKAMPDVSKILDNSFILKIKK
jgi:NitT/TauT family transport system substrate-binding protein